MRTHATEVAAHLKLNAAQPWKDANRDARPANLATVVYFGAGQEI
jgi:hypothetical protein